MWFAPLLRQNGKSDPQENREGLPYVRKNARFPCFNPLFCHYSRVNLEKQWDKRKEGKRPLF
jgi:hypothetical protein